LYSVDNDHKYKSYQQNIDSINCVLDSLKYNRQLILYTQDSLLTVIDSLKIIDTIYINKLNNVNKHEEQEHNYINSADVAELIEFYTNNISETSTL